MRTTYAVWKLQNSTGSAFSKRSVGVRDSEGVGEGTMDDGMRVPPLQRKRIGLVPLAWYKYR